MPPSILRFALPSLAAALGLGLAACAAADTSKGEAPRVQEKDVVIRHEACDIEAGGAEKVDVNGDGKPDIVKVKKAGREVCRAVDLNFDGLMDAFIYYEADGRERRRESDFDRDGRPDEIAYYAGGVIERKERETNYDGKLDTWDYYQAGALVRRERDSDGDKIIDQWWQFRDPNDPRCAVVASDRNADGRPDTDAVVDLCADKSPTPPKPTSSATSAPSAAAPAASGSSAPSAAPPAASGSSAPSAAPPAASGSSAPSAPSPAPAPKPTP
jgi:hypothetical protein